MTLLRAAVETAISKMLLTSEGGGGGGGGGRKNNIVVLTVADGLFGLYGLQC